MANKKSKKTAKVSVETPAPTNEPLVPAPVVATDTVSRFGALRIALDAVRDTTRLTPDTAPAALERATAAVPSDVKPGMHNRCRFSGLPVAVAQNALYVVNETEGWGFSDDVLAIGWHLMFPTNAAKIAGGAGFVSNVSKYIGGTRSLFNHHKHGALPPDMTFRPTQGRSAAKAQKPAESPAAADTVSTQEPVVAAA